jgi:hypothetical protein
MKFYKHSTAPADTTKHQREDLHGSGVYPSSGPWPKGDAELRAPEDWNERKLGPATAHDTAIKEKAKRARQGVRRRVKSDVDEAYSQGDQ